MIAIELLKVLRYLLFPPGSIKGNKCLVFNNYFIAILIAKLNLSVKTDTTMTQLGWQVDMFTRKISAAQARIVHSQFLEQPPKILLDQTAVKTS